MFTGNVAKVRDRKEWSAESACKDNAGPFMTDYPNKRDYLPICNSCPVATECLAHAIANNERGIWGGTTYRERQAMKLKDLGLTMKEVPQERLVADYLRDEPVTSPRLVEKVKASEENFLAKAWKERQEKISAVAKDRSSHLSQLLLSLPSIS